MQLSLLKQTELELEQYKLIAIAKRTEAGKRQYDVSLLRKGNITCWDCKQAVPGGSKNTTLQAAAKDGFNIFRAAVFRINLAYYAFAMILYLSYHHKAISNKLYVF